MIRGTATLLLVAALVGCGAKNVVLATDQCWRVSVGDYAHGTAILHAYAGGGCIECGAFLTTAACRTRIDFAITSDSVDRDYDRIVRQLPADPQLEGYVAGPVFVSGKIIPNGATGKPMLDAERLQLRR